MARKPISESTLKRLFSLSGNKCAFPGCQTRLVDRNKNFLGQICHIEAAEVGGQRYNPQQNDNERRSFENLIILCSNHHKVTDDVARYTVDKLLDMKASHEDIYLDSRFKVEIDTVKQAQNKSNKIQNYHNLNSGNQIIAKKGNIIINYGQKESKNPFYFLKNIFSLKLDNGIKKPRSENQNFKFFNIPDSFKYLYISDKINIDHSGEETRKLLKKISKRNSGETDKTSTQILESRIKTPLNDAAKQTIRKVISNLERSSTKDKEEIARVTTQNTKNLSKILNNLSDAKSNLELDEIEKIKNQGLISIEKQKAEILFSSGKAYLDLLMFKNAMSDLLEALKLDPENADILNEAFKLSLHVMNTEESSKLASNAIQLIDKTRDVHMLIKIYTNLGTYHFSLGEYEKAQQYYSEVKRYALFSSKTKSIQIQESTLRLAQVLLIQGKADGALKIIIDTLKNTLPRFDIDNPSLVSDEMVARMYNAIAIIFSINNQFDQALKYSKHFIKIITTLDNQNFTLPYNATLGYLNNGIIQFYKGNLKESHIQSSMAKEYIENNLGIDFSLLANTYANFGGIHLLEGNSKAALREYSKAEEILSSHQTRSNLLKMASIYCHEGNVYKMSEDFSKSRNLYEQALGILSDLFDSNSPNIVNLHYNLINPENSKNIILAF